MTLQPHSGIGDVNTSIDTVATTGNDVATFLTDEIITGFPNWMVIGGGILLWMLAGSRPSGGGSRRSSKKGGW